MIIQEMADLGLQAIDECIGSYGEKLLQSERRLLILRLVEKEHAAWTKINQNLISVTS